MIAQDTIEVAIPAGDAIVEKLRGLPGVTRATTEGTIRLYCDDGFAVLKEVVALLDRTGTRASVSMVEPSLEDAFGILVKNGTEVADG